MKNLIDYKAIQNLFKKYPVFKIVSNKIQCTQCVKQYTYNPAEGVRSLIQHLKKKTHINSKKIQSQLNFNVLDSKDRKDFNVQLIEAFLEANISIEKLSSPKLKILLEQLSGQQIYTPTWSRNKNLPEIYNSKYKSIISKYINQEIYLIFDETTDIKGRYILNILIGKCSEKERLQQNLIKTVQLEKTNAQNINLEIINLLNELFTTTLQFKNLRLLISDGALYCIKLGKLLKELIPTLKHVTCIVHLLHRFAEYLRAKSKNVDFITNSIKKILIKNKTNILLFKDTTGLSLPEFPIITRWGTWLNYSIFIAKNYKKIKDFLNLKEINAIDIENIKNVFNSKEFILELENLIEHENIILRIYKLESNTLTTKEQIEVLIKIKEKLKCQNDIIKFNNLLNKNPDLMYFLQFSAITCKNTGKIFGAVPLTSVDAERSFSKLNLTLTPERSNLLVENLSKLLFLYFNNK